MNRPALHDVPRDRLAVEFFTPPENLRPYVTGFNVYGTYSARRGAIEHFFPGWSTVRFNYSAVPWTIEIMNTPAQPVPDAVLFGPSSAEHRLRLAEDGISLGFGMTPLGQRRILGVPANRIANRMLPLGALWPEADDLHRRLGGFDSCGAAFDWLADVLSARLGRPGRHDALVGALNALLVSNHNVRVADACAQLGCSEPLLRRIALGYFGFPLKLLLRRSRFLKSLLAIYGHDAGTWSQRIDQSYYDQSHFIRDCREFLGTTPTEFLRHPRPMTELSMRKRTEKMGAAFLALHRAGPGDA